MAASGTAVNRNNVWRHRPQAPASGTPLCDLIAIAPGTAREFNFGVGLNVFRMFVVRNGANVFGYLNLCPHYSLPLNVRQNEFLSADGARILCRRHLAVFSIEDGLCIDGACDGNALSPVPLVVRDDMIVIA